MSARVWLVPILLVVGCATARESFKPTEHGTAEADGDLTAAAYDLMTPGGRLGEAKVWTTGAVHERLGAERRTVVRVSFEIENATDAPLVLVEDSLAVDDLRVEKQHYRAVGPVRLNGNMSIAARSVGRVTATFVAPRGLSPHDLDGFRVRWSVSGAGGRYEQVTPFKEEPRPASAYRPYDDPFLLGYPPGRIVILPGDPRYY